MHRTPSERLMAASRRVTDRSVEDEQSMQPQPQPQPQMLQYQQQQQPDPTLVRLVMPVAPGK